MRVLIAPDSFGGTLTAAEAARAMAAGWGAARPGDELRVVPMGDGGEGTLEVVAAACPDASRRTARVADALGVETLAEWLLLADGRAVVEAAQACGLSQLAQDQRDPRRTTTYGVGQLVTAALAESPREVVVGLGGSATVDGGAGLATALGHRLLRADGNGVKVGGEHLRELTSVVAAGSPEVPVTAATDVTNPLLGRRGAAAVFGPQKGADPDDVVLLEEALTTLADVVERDLPGGPWRNLPGAGAAGGLGFGLMAFCGARACSGAGVVAGLVGLDPEGIDIVLTGEGALDAQSAAGKVPVFMLAAGRRAGARVMAVAGRVGAEAGEPFDAVAELGPGGLEAAAELLEARTRGLAEGAEGLSP